MKPCNARKDGGFALIMAMLILFVLTILVVNAVRGSSMGEQMAGGYMDRNRAMQAAEQALRKGQAILMTLDDANDPLCLNGCDVINGTVTSPAVNPGFMAIPATWGATTAGNQTDFTIIDEEGGPVTTNLTASYKIALLDDSLLGTDKAGCKAYSIMGKGAGIDSRTEVILQTIAYACPAG